MEVRQFSFWGFALALAYIRATTSTMAIGLTTGAAGALAGAGALVGAAAGVLAGALEGAVATGVAASALDRPSLSRMVLKKPMVISRWR